MAADLQEKEKKLLLHVTYDSSITCEVASREDVEAWV
jgi:hypothetical protein